MSLKEMLKICAVMVFAFCIGDVCASQQRRSQMTEDQEKAANEKTLEEAEKLYYEENGEWPEYPEGLSTRQKINYLICRFMPPPRNVTPDILIDENSENSSDETEEAKMNK